MLESLYLAESVRLQSCWVNTCTCTCTCVADAFMVSACLVVPRLKLKAKRILSVGVITFQMYASLYTEYALALQAMLH